MIDVERVDFVSFPTRDIDQARRFYGETLELELETAGDNWLEFRAGQLTVALVEPSVPSVAFVRDGDGNQLMLHRRYAPRA